MIRCRPLPLLFLLGFALAGCSAASSEGRVKNHPYSVSGVRYQPLSVDQARGFEQSGVASWYGPERGWLFFGGGSERTANGEKVNARSLSAAHKRLPLPCVIEVTNLRNGRRAKLRVNDRGPFVGNRVLDVSSRAAKKLGFKQEGLTDVRLRVLRVGD